MAYKPRVLVVEQDKLTMRKIEATLRVMGATPCCLSSSRQAANLINKEKVDGAFLDWDTPELNGEQLTKTIRRSKSNRDVPIAMLTSRNDTRAIAAGFKAGVTFFLSKPVGPKELSRLLNASRGAMLKERRRYQRLQHRMPVGCKWGGKEVTGQSVNLSPSGMLMTLSTPPEAGAEIRLEISLPRSLRPLQLRGQVVRRGPGKQVRIKFLAVSAAQRAQLVKYIDQVKSMQSSMG